MVQCWGSLVIRVLPQIPWHEVVCLKQSVNASHAPVLPSSAVLSVVDGREAEVLGRLAGHAKIRAGWPAATADQQFSWSPNAGPYESCGHAESGSQTVDDDYQKWACTSAATAITAESHSLRVRAERMACRPGCSPQVWARGWTGGRCCSLAGTGRRRRGSRRRFTPELPCRQLVGRALCSGIARVRRAALDRLCEIDGPGAALRRAQSDADRTVRAWCPPGTLTPAQAELPGIAPSPP